MQKCCTDNCFSDFVKGCPDKIKVNAKLAATTDYFWSITDYHGNKYSFAFTTDEDGFGEIDTSELPSGLCNPASHGITIEVSEDEAGCKKVPLRFLQSFDCVSLSFNGGEIEKTEIGCAHD